MPDSCETRACPFCQTQTHKDRTECYSCGAESPTGQGCRKTLRVPNTYDKIQPCLEGLGHKGPHRFGPEISAPAPRTRTPPRTQKDRIPWWNG